MPVLYWLPTSLPCLFNEVGSIIVQNLANNSLSAVTTALLTVIGTNGIAEAILSAVIVTPIVIAIFKMQKKRI